MRLGRIEFGVDAPPRPRPPAGYTPWYMPVRKQPHLCPVCEGRGFKPMGFYTGENGASGARPVKCRTCRGEGVLWS